MEGEWFKKGLDAQSPNLCRKPLPGLSVDGGSRAVVSLRVVRGNSTRHALLEIDRRWRFLERARRMDGGQREQRCLTTKGEERSSLHLAPPISCAQFYFCLRQLGQTRDRVIVGRS